MKSISLVAIIVLTFIATTIYLNKRSNIDDYAEDGVLFAHKICANNSDCVWAETKCALSCGGSINKYFIEKHNETRELECKDYSGPRASMRCIVKQHICVNNSCQTK